jgi:hypothetical protein
LCKSHIFSSVVVVIVTEETTHVNVFWFILFGCLFFLCSSSSWSTGSTGWSSWCVFGGIKEGSGLWEIVTGLSCDGNQILEATEESVRS